MARNPAFRQGVGRVARDVTLPPSFTPVLETSQPDGTNFTGAGGGTGLGDPALMLGIDVVSGLFQGFVGGTTGFTIYADNPQFDKANATVTAQLNTANAGSTVTVTPDVGPGREVARVEIVWGTATTDPVEIEFTLTSDGGEDGPFTDTRTMTRIWPAQAATVAIAPNNALNIDDRAGSTANTLANIQTAFNDAVTRLNAQFQVSAEDTFAQQISPVGGEGWAGMTVPVVETFRDAADPTLAFMVQSTVNVRFGGNTAASCIGIGVNVAALDTEPDGGTATLQGLTAIMTHELIHGLGTPGVFFLERTSAVNNIAVLNAPTFADVNTFWNDNSGQAGNGVPLFTIGGEIADHWDNLASTRAGTQFSGVTNDIMIATVNLDTLASNNITDVTRLALQGQGYELVGGSAADAVANFTNTPRSLPAAVNFKLYIADPDITRDGNGLYEKYHKFS